MAWQRNIPFGYRMEQGGIVLHPEESEAVTLIYHLYLQGESYLKIAIAMTKRGIRYHVSSPQWNKHMVKRILENPKYAGCGAYPAIVAQELWQEAQAVRERKTTGWKSQPLCIETLKRRTVCGECGAPFDKHTSTNASGNRWWHCSNPECGCTLKMKDGALEDAVTALLNRVILQPELLQPADAADTFSLEAIRMQNEINRELGKPEPSEEYLTALIFGCAAEKYAMLGDSGRQTICVRLQQKLGKQPILTAFAPELFAEIAEALLVSESGVLALRLTGGNIIGASGKEPTTYADQDQ